MSRQTRRQTGLTLIELLIAMLVLGIFLAAAFGMVVRNNQMARQNQAKLNSTQAIRASADRMAPLLRKADQLLADTDAIPASVTTLCGAGFFAHATTGPSTLVLRSQVFQPDGTLTNQHNYAVLTADAGTKRLLATYVVMRPDGTLDYKRRDEVLVHDWVQPKDRAGNPLNTFSYFDEGGTQVASVTAANAGSIVRIRLSLASQDEDVREKQWSQLTSEIRLANRSTRSNIPFIVYNPNGASRTLNGIEVVGPATAVLTRVDFGATAVWTGSMTLAATPQQVPITLSPLPTITGTNSQPATLWFAPTSVFTGSYTVRFLTTANDSLASSFTN